MRTCILGCQYIPSAEYFAHWLVHDDIRIEAHENFQKRSWRNRTCILAPGEPLTLTVPLGKGKHQQMSIQEVLISCAEPWHEKHIRSLRTAYGKTAFAKEVLEGIFEILLLRKEKLWDLNVALLDYILSFLAGFPSYKLTNSFEATYPGEVSDLRMGIAAGHSNISFERIPVYPQVQRLHQSFQPNLSILDVLCHLGMDTKDYLSQYASQLYPQS